MKKTVEPSQLPAKVQIASQPKPKAPVAKPLSYEELMARAEKNSNNTLSLTDLKVKTGDNSIAVKSSKPVEMKIVPIVRKTPNKTVMVSKSLNEKKPVKIIKRNMQPRSEVSDLVVLNQKKRDLRSIEEIQLELKKKQSKPEIKKKKIEEDVDPEKNPEKYYAKNYSSIISNLFGYDRKKYAGNDDDDLSDMEADYSTVMAEEARCKRIAQQEDLEEELKDIERKRRKAAALLKSQKSSK